MPSISSSIFIHTRTFSLCLAFSVGVFFTVLVSLFTTSTTPFARLHFLPPTPPVPITYNRVQPAHFRTLITGAAGFIGYHTAVALRLQNHFVIGIDNFNSYYDPRLKRHRQQLLLRHQVDVVDADICNQQLIVQLLQRHHINRVVHLAAQAGVRYSLIEPRQYVRSNIECTIALFEAIRNVNANNNSSIDIVYASSSSVYGRSPKTKLAESDSIQSISSVYGASKYAVEMLARVYSRIYSLKMTGLRFFTVYGPLGRPDMAYYFFTENILQGRNITLFRTDSGAYARRDFTFVNDTVDGIISTLGRTKGADNEVINLGKGSPETVLEMVDILGKLLGKSPITRDGVLHLADVPSTYADVSLAKRLLGYHPRISLHDGLAEWVTWYSQYYNVN